MLYSVTLLLKDGLKTFSNSSNSNVFNFEEFADNFFKCKFRCLVSMNNTEEIRSLFKNANIFEFEKYHSMKYGGTGDHKVGKELLISNYDFPNI